MEAMTRLLLAVTLVAMVATLPVSFGKVTEEIRTTIDINDDEAAELSENQVAEARTELRKIGLKSTREKTMYTDAAGKEMERTTYTVTAPSSTERLVAHALVLHSVVPNVFTAADVQEVRDLEERRESDAAVGSVLNNKPRFMVKFTSERPAPATKTRKRRWLLKIDLSEKKFRVSIQLW
ncbi:uncharacterized protein LOC135804490 [Sycon ciliatum]|uniref:uncharacterized protein LOC135804490 n=1 Tax=Sycon ciliatum TaxID=27933 RepID=UPI0031F6EA0C